MNSIMTALTSQKCVPCEGTERPLTKKEYSVHLSRIDGWQDQDESKILKTFVFKNFIEAVAFVNKVADLAESEGHHPDINLHNWKKVTISLSTHAIKGLSLNDFILAAKIDTILNES